jgi:beta-glucanase (GH16 family)
MARNVRIAWCSVAVVLAACGGETSDNDAVMDATAGSQSGADAGANTASHTGSGGASSNGNASGTGGHSTGSGGSSTGSGGAHSSGTGGMPGSTLDASVHDAAMHDAGVPQDAGLSDGFDPGPGWKLAWHDEFDGPSGTSPDASRWVFETGGNGFGNNELEFYTDRKENAALDGDGMLVITARKESYMGRDYTSARMKTQGKFEHKYGRFEARIRIPKGQGIWPAFWMLGNDIGSPPWPDCGEIDIMENIGKEPTTVHGTIHGPGYSGGGGLGGPYMLPGNAPFADDFHVYAMEWSETKVRWLVDDHEYETRTTADLPDGKRWVYDHPFFLLLNVAVGGQWPGNPDGSTQFPQTMTIDFVRVYDAAP